MKCTVCVCQMDQDQEIPITTESIPVLLPITTESTPVLTSCVDYPLQADPNCPLHPATNDLPSPLPQGVTDALKSVESYLSTLINSTILVSSQQSPGPSCICTLNFLSIVL